LFKTLPSAFGTNGSFIIQLVSTQRSIENIIGENVNFENISKNIRANFKEQRTDFSIEFPYSGESGREGIVIEIDGSQHNNPEQRLLDIERDKAVSNANWINTLRIKTSEFDSNQISNKINNILYPALDNEYVKTNYTNFINPIWEEEFGMDILQLTLIPYGIARIQRALLEYIKQNEEFLSSVSKIKVAVLERDVPCGGIAIEDLKKLIVNLNNLSDEKIVFPNIELSVFSTEEFIDSQFHSYDPELIDYFDFKTPYDLLIDISVLERNNTPVVAYSNSKEIISIRSVHYKSTERKVETNSLINYYPFCKYSNENGEWEITNENVKVSLEYILKSVFRNPSFRNGQLPIIHNALQCRSVIGLLPTGGGKSLTYQFSSILQPGICLVIDPIKSLMKDQVRGLKEKSIDSCIFINSSLKGEDKRKAMRMFADGKMQFVFISPERLQMEDFRQLMKEMYEKERYFSYCVIDEAHCVSEWGHDFRTAYLKLGENAINYCKTKNLKSLPLFGLTATASYDVLADVQRELSGNNDLNRLADDSIVRSEFTKRNELQFIIEDVTFSTAGLRDNKSARLELGKRKQERLINLVEEIPNKIEDFIENPELVFGSEYEIDEHEIAFRNMTEKLTNFNSQNFYKEDNAALIFCPHTKGILGVTDKFKKQRNGLPAPRHGVLDVLEDLENISAGYFMGGGNENENDSNLIQIESNNNQDDFISGELNLMVATKAFGMGIDKSNIRYTIHMNYPSSIESYVQEAGRGGRDGQLALSYILFNQQIVETPLGKYDLDFDINYYFHKNSFKGIQKEWAIVEELLTEIYYPDRTFELENLIAYELDEQVSLNYWERENMKWLFINSENNESLGHFDLKNLRGNFNKSVNIDLSNKIFLTLSRYINNQNLNEPVHIWIQNGDKQIGIEEILKSKKNGENFRVTVAFQNNTKERIKFLATWLGEVIDKRFNEEEVKKLMKNSSNALEFIENISEKYESLTRKNLDFEEYCNNRDVTRGVTLGTAYERFMALYDGNRDKLDTEKAIYRLSTLGIIDDYTINFQSRTFTLIGKRKSENDYLKNLKNHLLKYLSKKTTDLKLKSLGAIDEDSLLRKCLKFLIQFVYSETERKRINALKDMKDACIIGLIDNGSIELKNYIDLYFNSKYARSGYSFINSNGIEINASLPDITEEGKNSKMSVVWDFMDFVYEDPKASEIDNIKHLRGACVRMLSNQYNNYTLLLLNAFTLYMLEFRNSKYLAEAEELIMEAFNQLEIQEPGIDEKRQEQYFNKFIKKILEKNQELDEQMTKHGFYFDFDLINLKKFIEPLERASQTLKTLNLKLNEYDKSNGIQN
jgi:ATP-dependent DNA helicase RecQ